MIIKFKRLVPEAKEPYKVNDVDAGFDLYATSYQEFDGYIEYHTGIAFEIPDGYVGLVFPRSSITKYDLMLKNSVGVIDSSYRGEIICRFYQLDSNNAYRVNMGLVQFGNNKYAIGERIAQIVFVEIPKIKLVESDELSETNRGNGGFGSTGN